ncbi:hypothetical protein B3286c1_0391 [Brucella vulpis]|nr:hypothetical protein BF3285c1_0391 [Brucella vulpis]CUW49228.1 hypothetical protein B3286c1_0391 [Brucella vulpis]
MRLDINDENLRRRWRGAPRRLCQGGLRRKNNKSGPCRKTPDGTVQSHGGNSPLLSRIATR